MTSDEQLLKDDIAARKAALDVRRSFIVQAPAGSGKTELLIQRYLKLLATVNEPEEVLAITFTRKAAAEMRYRVVQALLAAEQGEVPDEPHLRLTFDAASDVLARDRTRDWQLIVNPGRMRIQTLDSVNAAIARMQPISSGHGTANNAIAADAQMRALYRRAAYLTLEQLGEEGELQAATASVLQHLDNNTSLYCSYIAKMLATRDQWLPFIASGRVDADEAKQLRLRLEQNLANAVFARLAELHASLPAGVEERLLASASYAAGELLTMEKGDHAVVVLHDAKRLGVATPDDVKVWQGLAELLLTGQGTWRKRVTVTQGFPPKNAEQKAEFMDVLADLARATDLQRLLHAARELPPTRYTDDQWSVLLAVFRLLPLAVIELQRLFVERGVTDYIEVALSAASNLGTPDEPGDVALLLDYQLRHLLVDEMQDTASAQYQLLEALTAGWQDGDGRTLFCVGDPMQSIYRFRNAEVGEFLMAQKFGIGDLQLNPLTLRRNFRSGEHLVHWFNNVFPSVLASENDVAYSAVAYVPAAPVPQLANLGECTTHTQFGNNADFEAAHGCAVIQQVLAAHRDDDMAVLVRSRTHLREMLAQLRRANIAYNAIEIDRLTDLPEIIDVLALTRALAHLGDRVAWLGLLRSPLAGLDWTDLHKLVGEAPRNRTVWELLQGDEKLGQLSAYGQRSARRLRDALAIELRPNRVDSLRDRVERLWLQLGGPAILPQESATDNVYRYFDVLSGLEQGGELADVASLESALDLEHVSQESDARLHIMTMHRAKGLQFDHVLLYGLGHAPGRQEKSVLSWFDVPAEGDFSEKVLSPIGPRMEIEGDPVHKFIENTEQIKYQHELGRLLYVACTRAKFSLHLMGHVELNAEQTEIRTPRANTLLRLLWPHVQEDYTRDFASFDKKVEATNDAVWRKPQLRRFEADWQLPDFHELPDSRATPQAVSELAEVEFYWVGNEARIAGTLVHRWLHRVTVDPAMQDSNFLRKVEPVTRRWLRGMGIGNGPADEICARVKNALQSTLKDATGRWLLSGSGSAELALGGLLDGELTAVVLDRVRIDEDGTHWIVDYKTSSHEGGNLDAFLEAEVVRYKPQLLKYWQLYRDVADVDARCALYFPLLQKFVPVAL